jgi:hypothetical protein
VAHALGTLGAAGSALLNAHLATDPRSGHSTGNAADHRAARTGDRSARDRADAGATDPLLRGRAGRKGDKGESRPRNFLHRCLQGGQASINAHEATEVAAVLLSALPARWMTADTARA